ncbi:dolichyl-diphosphooligosaccharide--protein glycosyltransferase subunit 1 [Coemansia sp. RSA 2703]|nr:dolichyl-diphosphooligosaccharide--protein glycosyltransferase subunit 1 [Coemansia sp. RSA 2703]
MVRPLPEGNVAQTDDQRWAWDDALLVASPYPTRKQKTIVALDKSARLVRYEGTRGSLSDESGNVVFGPFAGSDREAVGNGRVVYVSNAEHLEATHVRREYFASHWDDTLHVSDSFDVRNAGPQTPGHAVDSVQRMMTRFTGARDNLVKQFAQHVPVDAREVFFVDAIGNVSTSAVDRVPGSPGKRMLRLKPRFPLAGGWRYAWRHGYRLPLGQHLRHDASGRFRLRVPFIEPLVASAADDKQPVRSERTAAVLAYELHVTLPQGARNVAVHAAFDAEYSVQRAKHYLDAPGVARPVVVVAMRNVPPEMMREHVVVSYDLSWAAVWLKPAAVAACVLALFALASVVGRLQLGLAPVAGKAKAKAKAD